MKRHQKTLERHTHPRTGSEMVLTYWKDRQTGRHLVTVQGTDCEFGFWRFQAVEEARALWRRLRVRAEKLGYQMA